MLILDATNESLQVVLGGAVATNQLPFTASYVDLTTTAFTPANNIGTSNNTTDVDIVAAPASSTQRQVKYVSVRNSDTASATVTIKIDAGGTERIIWSGTLQVGDTLQYTDGAGWSVLDSQGRIKNSNESVVGRSESSFRHIGGSGLEAWYYANCNNATALTTGAPTANTLRALPFIAPSRGGTLDRLGFNVTTGVAGNARIGLYANVSTDSNLYPGTLLDQSADIDCTANATRTLSISRALTPGALYWLAIVGAVAPTIRCLAVGGCSHILGISSAMGTAPNVGISVAFTYGAMPSTFTGGGAMITAVPIPALAYRFSA